MSRLRIREVVVVEGKYDATAVSGLIDGLVLTTDGFSIFQDEEKKDLLRRLGKERGLIILTDSDAAGFQIRRYVESIAGDCTIKHGYIPAVQGKESRKPVPSKEGTLGVEGLPPEVLRAALEKAGATSAPERRGRRITYTDLFELGLSGGAGSAGKRREVLARLGLPPRLSKKALLEVLDSLYTYDEFKAAAADKPALFWDFHGTLSLPAVAWFDAALGAIDAVAPHKQVSRERMAKELDFHCLPWWEFPDRDTRSVRGSEAWWAFSEKGFVETFLRCGLDETEAKQAAPMLRAHIIHHESYSLYPDAIPTLQALQQRGYRSYILSNNFPELPEVLESLGLLPYFSGMVVSGIEGYEKPRREIFDIARRLAGEPAEAWMVGDNPHDDIEGGNAAGFVTVAVHAGEVPAATHSVENLADILALLP